MLFHADVPLRPARQHRPDCGSLLALSAPGRLLLEGELESSPEFKRRIHALTRRPEFGLARHDAIFDDKPIRDDISDIPSLRNGDLFEVELQFGCDRNRLRLP